MINYINREILKSSSGLDYIVKPEAPNSIEALMQSSSLVIWDGESNNTVFDDAKVNFAFRALHDSMHLETGLDFSPEQEIELGRIQASRLAADCKGFLADLFYIEIAEQAKYYLKNGVFVDDQRSFTLDLLKLN